MSIIRIAVSVVLAIGSAGYLLPTAIALARDLPVTNKVFIVNLFFGWTIVGWFVSLVWSISG